VQIVNIRRLVLDVDKAINRPTLIELAAAIEGADGVEGFNITVTEIDIETVGMDVTVEGEAIDYPGLCKAINRPTLIELAAAIEGADGVEGFNITVTEIDIETVGMDVTVALCAGIEPDQPA
jgi:hypothetical protein